MSPKMSLRDNECNARSKMESFRSIPFSAFAGVLILLLVVVQVDAQSRPDEVAALMSFRGTLGNSSKSAPYWFTWNENDENACAWVGVTCTANYTVEALDFSNWGLTDVGSFIPLSKLPDLRQLDMSFNSIVKGFKIPDDVGSMTQIARLDLSASHFGGSIPLSITSCKNLKYLSLEQNMISGTIPDLRELVDLQFLLLSDNRLYGSFPSDFGEIYSIVNVDISRNQLSGVIPSLLNSTNLRTLLLDGNILDGFVEPMSINAPNLQQLSISQNQLHGSIPQALSNLPNLMTLNMSFNFLSGSIPSGLSNVTGVGFSVDLSHNQLSGSIPIDLLQPPDGITLFNSTIVLSYNLLNGTIPTPTTTSSEADSQYLDLSHNQLTGPIPMSLAYWGHCYLQYNNLTGDLADSLPSAQPIGGAISLQLGHNSLSGDLSKITNLFTNWIYLAELDLSNNKLTSTVTASNPDPLGSLMANLPSYMQHFLIGGNNFSGTPLPVSIGNLTKRFNTLDLSNCQLGGTISGNVFNSQRMPNLETLNLSYNSAVGPVPDDFLTFSDLVVLDLSYNDLSGQLPYVPLTSPLNNRSILVGNAGLCGYPLEQCPEPYSNHTTGVQWWTLVIIICGSLLIAVASCLMVTWRWRVYHKIHEQDADLIRTLMERELVTLMPLRNLKKATNNFAESAQIGEGGFGTVFVGTLNDGTRVAIKKSKREGSGKDKELFLNEVRILSQVNHRHLVKLMGCCMENKIALLVFEFVPNGTLQDHLRGKMGDSHLTWKERLYIAVQTADALNYLHSATTFPIYHRDVKSANILLNDDLSAKVADFGLSKLAPAKATHVSTALRGTLGYMDPEYWVSYQLTEKSDVYSFGVVLLELISAKPAIDFRRDEDETSLVSFATPYIQNEDLDTLIDPNLLDTYNEQDGYGKKSILDMGRLALRCADVQSISRPSMNQVWKELQDICFKYEVTFMLSC